MNPMPSMLSLYSLQVVCFSKTFVKICLFHKFSMSNLNILCELRLSEVYRRTKRNFLEDQIPNNFTSRYI